MDGTWRCCAPRAASRCAGAGQILDAPRADDERTVAAMLQGIGQLGLEALPWEAESRGLQARMEFVRGLGRAILPAGPRATMRH